MGFLDKVKMGAGQAAADAKEKVDELQTKSEIVKTYESLGRKTFELADKGLVSHDEITPYVAKINELKDHLEQLDLGAQDPAPPESK
jgi:archaellum component FlaC